MTGLGGGDGGAGPRRWVLRVRSDDRPGVLAALAAVFASRGVNVDGVVALRGAHAGPPGTLGWVFSATRRRAEQLARTAERLDAVASVELAPADGPTRDALREVLD